MTLPHSDAPTAAEVLARVPYDIWVSHERNIRNQLDALAAAFPYLCWDVTDPEQLKQAGFIERASVGTRSVWLAPERKTTHTHDDNGVLCRGCDLEENQ